MVCQEEACKISSQNSNLKAPKHGEVGEVDRVAAPEWLLQVVVILTSPCMELVHAIGVKCTKPKPLVPMVAKCGLGFQIQDLTNLVVRDGSRIKALGQAVDFE